MEVFVWIRGSIHRIPASLLVLTCSQICACVILSLPISAATLKIYVDNIKVAKGSFTGPSCLQQHRLKSWNVAAARMQKYGPTRLLGAFLGSMRRKPDKEGRRHAYFLVVYLISCENQPGNVTFIPKHVWFQLPAKMPGAHLHPS